MNSRLKALILCLIPPLLMGGCLSMGSQIDSDSLQPEADSYTLSEHSAISKTGCSFDYRTYQPTRAKSATSIIIGHGFLRDQNNMAGLSRALAKRGIPVITLDFCNMQAWNGNHETNAQDMRNLAVQLGRGDNIIYAGFSAGALAAILAADDNTRAILALDLVDQNELALQAIKQRSVPLIGVSGPASECNANNQSNLVFSARNDERLEQLSIVPGASHCEFESPTNWLCDLLCGDDDTQHSDNMQRMNIIDKSIEAVTPFLSPPVVAQPTQLSKRF